MARYWNQSIVKGERALELFTNRSDICANFLRWLNVDPAPNTVAVFHGDGGNGKSLLLRYLEERLAKRLSHSAWQHVRLLPDAKLIETVASGFEASRVPVVRLDFQGSEGSERERQGREALLKIRRELIPRAFQFPLFDYAIIELMREEGTLTEIELKHTFVTKHSNEFNLIMELVSLANSNIVAGTAASLTRYINARLGNGFSKLIRERKIADEDITAIRQMARSGELIDVLPSLFADDLNANMRTRERSQRLVLMFDTHEAFWNTDRNLDGILYFKRDEWLRCLVSTLDLTLGVVAIVSGREPVRWHERSGNEIPFNKLNMISVDDLSRADAEEYLQKSGVDSTLWPVLLADAQVSIDKFHPFRLGLGADAIAAALRSGYEVTPATIDELNSSIDLDGDLVRRLLKYVGRETVQAIAELSAARSFDFDLFRMLGSEIGFRTTVGDFEIVTDFSFVRRQAQADPPRFRLHDRLRKLDLDGVYRGGTKRQTHQVLEKYFRSLSNDASTAVRENAVCESIYHLNRLNWREGVNEWLEVFRDRMRSARYESCRPLMDVRPELEIDSDFDEAMMAYWEAEYLAQVSRYSESLAIYNLAISTFSLFMETAPASAVAFNGKANALQGRGNVEADLGRFEDALTSYTNAISEYDEGLRLFPPVASLHHDRANALHSLGNLEARRERITDAIHTYGLPLSGYDHALRILPRYFDAHMNRANTFQRRGVLEAQINHKDGALTSYELAIAGFDLALSFNSNEGLPHRLRATTLRNRGDLEVGLGRTDDARSSYFRALEGFDCALNVAPGSVQAHYGRAETLRMRGELEAYLERFADAIESYSLATAGYDRTVELAPDHIGSLVGRRQSSISHALVLLRRRGPDDVHTAKRIEQLACADLERQIAVAPESVEAAAAWKEIDAIRADYR